MVMSVVGSSMSSSLGSSGELGVFLSRRTDRLKERRNQFDSLTSILGSSDKTSMAAIKRQMCTSSGAYVGSVMCGSMYYGCCIPLNM